MTKIDIYRAILNFPLDLAFLGLSFGIIYLANSDSREPASTFYEVISVFLAYIVFACAVAFTCRRSDVLFNRDEIGKPVVWAGINYFIAFSVLGISLYIQKP